MLFALLVFILFTLISLSICFTDALLIYLHPSLQLCSTSRTSRCRSFRVLLREYCAFHISPLFIPDHKFMFLAPVASSTVPPGKNI
jgi:hypothetical protein